MLRPATPLTLLLFVAFVLLLLSVISTPIVHGIPLASFQGVDFGVFGYCPKNAKCSGIKVGYNADLKSNDDEDFSLPRSARSSLSSILIVHPIAAFLALICLILAASAHLHSPSHSPRYLLALLILLLPTLLITLLAFLVDILLFVPHLAWGGWIVLASTILITASGVVTCAMRRTLVSRKARKKRIAQNAEMNGENYYGQQNATAVDSQPPSSQSIGPVVNGVARPDQLPSFTTYDSKTQGIGDDDRTPLNMRTPSNRTAPSHGTRAEISEDGSEKYGGMGRAGPGGPRGGYAGSFHPPRDEFGNPLLSSNAFGPPPPAGFQREPSDPRMTRQHSSETMNSQGSRGRGRGGYPGRGYGRGGPYGPGRGPGFSNGNGRGIPMGPLAAAAVVDGGMMANGMGNRRPEGAPPGYGNGYRPEGRAFPSQYNGDHSSGFAGAAMYPRDPSRSAYGGSPSSGPPSAAVDYERQPPPSMLPAAPGGYLTSAAPGPQPGQPARYGRTPSPGPPSAAGGAYGYVVREPSPRPGAHSYQAAPPPPPMLDRQSSEGPIIGQAVEMDALTGSPAQHPAHTRDSDVPAPGWTGMQPRNQHRESPLSMTSVYSTQEAYVPPRAAWAAAASGKSTPPQNFARPLSPMHSAPAELPNPPISNVVQLPMHALSHSPPPAEGDTFLASPISPITPISHVRMNSSGNYYEDVDPRFTDPIPIPPPPPIPPSQPVPAIPRALTPGGGGQPNLAHRPPSQSSNYHPPQLQQLHSYGSTSDGGTPPPRREISDPSNNYSSGPQQHGGVDLHWRPPPSGGPSGMGMGGIPHRRPVQQPQSQPTDVLQSNPDFEIARGPQR